MNNIDNFLGVILFTDLKDYTLKTSLLTQKQMDEILDNQDLIIKNSLKKYDGNLIKIIGDSYMIYFIDPLNSLLFSINIQEQLKKYNDAKLLNLLKIEIRIALDYGMIHRKEIFKGSDYFGETVNISARLIGKTIENSIFITERFYKSINNEKIDARFSFLGDANFKGIIDKIGVYQVLYLEDEIKLYDNGKYKNLDFTSIILDDKTKIRIKNIDEIILKASSVNAILGSQPIPFIEMYSSVIIYIYMLKQIAYEYNIKLSNNEIKEIIIVLFSSLGTSLFVGESVNIISKIGLVGFGGFLIIPLNFGTAYGVGKVINRYFYNKTKDINLSNSEIKDLFLSGKDVGIKYAKQNKKQVIETGKNFKDDFINKTNKMKKEIDNIINELKNFL
nr:adenylate/guanylate cyclase domain-containing protein [Candidatus Gracilibacteria bacterium]